MMRRNSSLLHILGLVVCILVYGSHGAYGAKGVCPGMSVPQCVLEAPDSEKARQYLGQENLTSFSISQIPAKYVLVELYSLYCPVCQRQAPVANKIYRFIQNDPSLGKDIKVIGIGAGNNKKETCFYRDKYRVPFPLFPDPKFDVYKKFGEPRTPFTVLVTNSGKVLLTHFGVVKDIDEFLAQIRKFHQQQ